VLWNIVRFDGLGEHDYDVIGTGHISA